MGRREREGDREEGDRKKEKCRKGEAEQNEVMWRKGRQRKR